ISRNPNSPALSDRALRAVSVPPGTDPRSTSYYSAERSFRYGSFRDSVSWARINIPLRRGTSQLLQRFPIESGFFPSKNSIDQLPTRDNVQFKPGRIPVTPATVVLRDRSDIDLTDRAQTELHPSILTLEPA